MGQGAMFPTWFRLLSLALIGDQILFCILPLEAGTMRAQATRATGTAAAIEQDKSDMRAAP